MLTRPQAFTLPALDTVLSDATFLEEQFRVADETPVVTAHLLRLMRNVPVGGKQVHDANIVATMQVHGIRRLLIFNVADFARFTNVIELVDPLAGGT